MDLIELKKKGLENFVRHPWEQARLRVLHFFLKKYLPGKSSLADVGSGDAFIAQSLAKAFSQYNVAAVDPHYTPEIIESIKIPELKNIHFYKTINHMIADHHKPLNAVVLMDVIEHVENPSALLAELKEVGSQGAYYFVTVPAFQILFSSHDEALGHFRRYNRKEITALMKWNGFTILQSGYFFNSLFLVRVLQKIIKSNNTNNQLYNWKGGTALSNIISSFFYVEFKISWYLSRLGLHLPGLTAYCLCRQ